MSSIFKIIYKKILLYLFKKINKYFQNEITKCLIENEKFKIKIKYHSLFLCLFKPNLFTKEIYQISLITKFKTYFSLTDINKDIGFVNMINSNLTNLKFFNERIAQYVILENYLFNSNDYIDNLKELKYKHKILIDKLPNIIKNLNEEDKQKFQLIYSELFNRLILLIEISIN